MDISHVIAFFSGVLGKVFGTWLLHFFREAVVPYFQKITNPHVSVTDEWILNHVGTPFDGDNLSATWKVQFKMRQKGHSVVGTATSLCVTGPDTLVNKTIEYKIQGDYSNNILNLHLTEVDEKERNKSSLMLQLVGDGSEFEGYRLFLGRAKNQIRAIECKLIRKGACAKCGTA